MGRNRKRYKFSLHQQAYNALQERIAFGQSKSEARAQGTAWMYIFSFGTYAIYWRHIKYFLNYVVKNHPECKTLKKAKQYAPEWLQFRMDQGLSAWTIHLESCALKKLFLVKPGEKGFIELPERKRADIKRSRGPVESDYRFSVEKNAELIAFCQGTGLRRSELEALRSNDLLTKTEIRKEIRCLEALRELKPEEAKHLRALKDTKFFEEQYYVHVRKGKGGRERLSPIIGSAADQIVERFLRTPENEKVWKKVHCEADIHSFRAEYATSLYNMHARPIDQIPYDRKKKGSGNLYQSQVYCCKRDLKGVKLDKKAMLVCSKALGHNRIDVVAYSYIRVEK